MINKKWVVIGISFLVLIAVFSLYYFILGGEERPDYPYLFDEDVTKPIRLSEGEVIEIVEEEKGGKETFDEFNVNTKDKPIEEVMEVIEDYETDPNASLKDRFYECASITKTSIAECSKIERTYKKIECVEAYYMFKAIEKNDPNTCMEFGTHKINNWCKAFLTGDEKYCDDPLFENEAFRVVCVALARQDLSVCKGSEFNCYFDYDLIVGRSKSDPSLCDNYAPYTTKFGITYCKALVMGNYQFCLDNFYYGIGAYDE